MQHLREKLIIAGLSLLPLVVGLVSVVLNGYEAVANSYVFTAYAIITVFTVPSLISKVIFRRDFLGLTTVYSFLWYPALYLVGIALANVLSIPSESTLLALALINILYWHYLLCFHIILERKDQLLRQIKSLFPALIPWLAYMAFLLFIVRQPGTIVAQDYLQHQTVTNYLGLGELCLLPGQCSNLFLQQGYTTFYHVILGFVGSFLELDITKVFFTLDLVWPLFASLVLVKLFSQQTKNKLLILLGVTISLLTFVNGAYEFIFFIPQTLCLYFFLQIFTGKELVFKKLIAGIIILLFTHFVLGAFLSGMLVIYHILKHRQGTLKKIGLNYNRLALPLIVLIGFVVGFNLAGFSVEKNLQAAELAVVGSETNLYSPHNFYFVAGLFGFAGVLMLLAIINHMHDKRKSALTVTAFTYLCINIIVYFLAPTYANKFFMGVGIWAAILTLDYLREIKFTRISAIAFVILLTLSLGLNFNINYGSYLNFYKQQNGTLSALTENDMEVINYLRDNPQKCLIISDPLSQLVVAAYTGHETARAQYMKPESREAIQEFNLAPNSTNLKSLKVIEEVSSADRLCYLYTGRLANATRTSDSGWTGNIYNILLDGYSIEAADDVTRYLTAETKLVVRLDSALLFQL